MLIVAISLSLLFSVRGSGEKMPVILLAITSCIGLAGIDFYYALNNVISDIYLVDGIIQVITLIAWITILITGRKATRKEN